MGDLNVCENKSIPFFFSILLWPNNIGGEINLRVPVEGVFMGQCPE